MAFEVFDDVAFFYLAMAVVAMAVLPWTLLKGGFALYRALQKPELIPLTRIQKLKLAQSQAQASAGAKDAAAASNTTAVDDPDTAAALAKSNAAASGLTQENLRPAGRWLSCGNITLAILWLVLLLMLVQIPSYSDQNLAKFDPYEILHLDKTATDQQIKRAYRKQSLQYHPDHNSSPEAAQQFMLVAKAHEALTSETAKKNIERYGNPDGYQGVSVTIGLPSLLTRKENEMRVLVVYFLLFILLPPIVVWVWWRRAREFVDGGTMKKTLAMWAQLMLPNQGSKQLVEFLAIAAEFESLVAPEGAAQGAAGAGLSASLGAASPQAAAEVAEFKKLAAEVKPSQFKQRFADPKNFRPYFISYVTRASVLLHAYLLRIKLPTAAMRADLTKILGDAHRLLGVMLELAFARGFIQTVFGVIDLQQLVTQGLFAHDSPLLQLPHLTAADCRKLAHKNIKTVLQLLKAEPERLRKLLPDVTESQWASIRSVAELIPDVRVSSSYQVEDEEGLYEGDLVTLKVKMDRQSFDPDKPEEHTNNKTRVSKHEGGDDVSASSDIVPSASPAPAEDKIVAAASAPGKSVSPASGDLPPMTDDEILDTLPHPKAPPAVPDLLQSGPSVHSLTFPHPKHEKWTVLLLEKVAKKADRLVGLAKVPSFFDEAEVELRFLAPKYQTAKELGLPHGDAGAGTTHYELHVLCDSYVGVDVVRPFVMRVEKSRHASAEEHAREVKSKVAVEYAALGDDGEPELDADGNPVPRLEGLGGMLAQALQGEYEEGYWYYLGFSSFWELLLNGIVLGLLGVFIFNFMHSRGYWQRWVTPSVSFVSSYTAPVWAAVYPTLAPVADPASEYFNAAYEWTANMLHRDPEPPERHPLDVHVDENNVPGMGEAAHDDDDGEDEEAEGAANTQQQQQQQQQQEAAAAAQEAAPNQAGKQQRKAKKD